MRLAVLGGSFNPVHNGHLSLAKDVHEILGYDRILFVPANLPPHKTLAAGASAEDRLEMLHLALDGLDYAGVEDCELARGGVSYTIETIEWLERKYAGTLEGKIGLVIGQDLAAGFLSWRDSPRIAEKTDIILAGRPGSGFAGFPYPFRTVANSPVEVSSTEIRACARDGERLARLVPPAVYGYIEKHTLYEH